MRMSAFELGFLFTYVFLNLIAAICGHIRRGEDNRIYGNKQKIPIIPITFLFPLFFAGYFAQNIFESFLFKNLRD